MSNDIEFVRVEYYGGSRKFIYFWKCNRCGNEYDTYSAQTNGFCKDCQKILSKERILKRDIELMKKAEKKLIERIKKSDLSEIPSLNVNGILYYEADAIKKYIGDMVEKQEKNTGDNK